MPILPLQPITPAEPSAQFYDRWLGAIQERLGADGADWNRLARDVLFELYYPGHRDYDTLVADPALPGGARAGLLAMDPRNITLEPEYYADVDTARFARVKPLLWLWYSFDRSPAGGQNVHLGVRFRRILAPFIFARCGRNFKCFQHVEMSFGYNLEVGDDVVVHRHVLLDDRGGITLGNRVSISDYANIYSHTHSIVDQQDVTNARTILEDDVRITYHATVLAGIRVRRRTPWSGRAPWPPRTYAPYHVNVGIPAKSVRVKPNAPASAYSTERVAHGTTVNDRARWRTAVRLPPPFVPSRESWPPRWAACRRPPAGASPRTASPRCCSISNRLRPVVLASAAPAVAILRGTAVVRWRCWRPRPRLCWSRSRGAHAARGPRARPPARHRADRSSSGAAENSPRWRS